MTTERNPKTAKERQAKRRKEMEEKGYKNLSLGFVQTRYHKALKKLVKQIDEGGISDDLKVKTVKDTSECDALKKRITELEGALKVARQDLAFQMKRADEQSEKAGARQTQLDSFKNIVWRLFWLK